MNTEIIDDTNVIAYCDEYTIVQFVHPNYTLSQIKYISPFLDACFGDAFKGKEYTIVKITYGKYLIRSVDIESVLRNLQNAEYTIFAKNMRTALG